MRRKIISAGSLKGSVAAGLLMLLILGLAAYGSEPGAGPAQSGGPAFGDGNLERVRRFLAETAAPGNRLDDYYFVLIGDIQNSVRDLGHPVFNVIAKDIQGAVDERTGERLYDKIRFVILLGDLVYEGPAARQWESLEKMFAGRGPDKTTYPYVELLARDKPIFPAIGNHELLSFRFHPQTRHKDLFDSPLGVDRFKAFFDW
ncbi:MAG: metallophosphoesterase family protein, partial [Candidatus Aminicenantales bacterium]